MKPHDTRQDYGAEEYRRLALAGARLELRRLLELFPELRQELTKTAPAGPAHYVDPIRKHVITHWRKTAKPAAAGSYRAEINVPANGQRAPLSVRAALEPLLTSKAKDTPTLRAELDATGYQHTGSTNLNNRIAQEAGALVLAGRARKTKRGWRLAAKGAPKK